MEAVLTNGVDCLFGGKKGILLSNIKRPLKDEGEAYIYYVYVMKNTLYIRNEKGSQK